MLNYLWKDRRICLRVKERHRHFMMTYVAFVGLVLCMLKTLFMKVYSGCVTKNTHLADTK
jgi:nitrogen fixation protein FixH